MIGIDTNLLVYAHRTGVPEHEAAKQVLERAAADRRGWGFTLPTVAEFWRVVTHPRCAGGPSSGAMAAAFLRALVDRAGAELWQPGPVFGKRLLQLATEKGVTDSHVHDLQIALTAFDNGATEIWSHDRSFVSVPGLPVLDPLAPPDEVAEPQIFI